MRKLWERVVRQTRVLKHTVRQKLYELKKPYIKWKLRDDPTVQRLTPAYKVAQASTMLRQKWPELAGLAAAAREKLKAKGIERFYHDMMDEVMMGKIGVMSEWTPEKKNAGLIFIQMHLAGVEIPKEKMPLLGLDEDDKRYLISFAKNFPDYGHQK